jgi:hypothetical protein
MAGPRELWPGRLSRVVRGGTARPRVRRALTAVVAGAAFPVFVMAVPGQPVTTTAAAPLRAARALAVTTWTAAQAPLPANADHTFAQLSAVACPSASVCTAVGSYTGSAGWQGLLLAKSGSSWAATQAPLPAGAAADPYATPGSVACASASSCAAVGVYQDSSYNQQGLLLTGSGSSWAAAKAPLPAGAAAVPGTTLGSVACNSASASCVAVGSYQDASGNSQGVLLTGSGSSWTAIQAPLPSGADANPRVRLDSVKCPAASTCIAVGSYEDAASSSAQGLLLTGSGSSWTATQAPLPADVDTGDPLVSISSVACSSGSLCTAVGTYNDQSDDPQGLLLTGSGTSWAATEAPLPPPAPGGSDLQFGSVTCPAASECTAAVSRVNDDGPGQAFLLKGSGSSWTVTHAPLPGNAGMEPPFRPSVACASAAACLVAGSYDTASNNVVGLLISGAASSWSAIAAPVPSNAGTSTASEQAVACAKRASACVAVGYYRDKSGNDQGLLLTGPP